MFNTLLSDLHTLKISDLEGKVADLSRKYFIAARSGNSALCEQIVVILESYKSELQIRLIDATKIQTKNQTTDLDGLINVNK